MQNRKIKSINRNSVKELDSISPALKKQNYNEASEIYQKYKLNLSDEIGMKYTSKLEHVIKDLKNCEKCKSLFEFINVIRK